MPRLLIFIFFLWFLSGFIPSVGFFYANLKNEFPNIHDFRKDLGWSLTLGICYGFLGPLGFLISYLATGFAEHGWEVKP